MEWKKDYQSKLVSVEDAARQIKSNDRIWYSPCGSVPVDVINEICKRKDELFNVHMFSGLVLNAFEYFKPDYIGHMSHTTLFMGPVERKFLHLGNVNVLAYQFGHMDWVIKNVVKPDVFILEAPPPDANGKFSYGMLGTVAGDVAAKTAKTIIVQVNGKAPYVRGSDEAFISVKDVHFICEKDHPAAALPIMPVSEIENKIAAHLTPFIEDGSTIQIGIGGLGNAIGYSLEHHRDLGIHTEMFVDSMVTLAEKGVVTGSRKTLHPGEITCSFGIGSQKLYDFMGSNKNLRAYPISYIADENVIGRNKNFVSINNAIMSDLTGQVCSESIGHAQFSGTGGQLNFVRGCWRSEGGKSFLTLESTFKLPDGTLGSRITASLPPGAVITTPRTDVQYIVTEYGVANLRGRTIPDRVNALIAIAHPDFRDDLRKQAVEAGLIRKVHL